MVVNTSYKIVHNQPRFCIVYEYWDDLHIMSYRVDKKYNGGDLVEFLEKNECCSYPNFSGLQKFEEKMSILDF